MTPVQEIMSSDVLSIAPTASVLEALRMMSGADVRHLPVVDDGRLVGIISDRDIHRFEGADGVSDNVVMRHLTAPVSASMSTALHTVTPTTSLDEAAQAMIDAKVGALPVVEGDAVVGMVSTIDLLAWLRRQGRLDA